jgi:hypothetical protein
MVALAVIFLIWAFFSVLGLMIFMWAWNFVAPLFWAAAPHITFLQAFAIGVVVGVVRSVVSVTVNAAKS